MKTRTAVSVALLAMATALPACVVLPVPSHAVSRPVYAPYAPPPPRVEYRPAPPRNDYFWIQGHWFWEGNQHRWADGHWEAPRQREHWEAHRWEQDEHGRWQSHGGEWRHD